MRILACTILSAALLGGTFTAVNWRRSAEAVEDGTLNSAIAARRSLEREIGIRAAMKEAELNPMGWPKTIDPAWFAAGAPRNPYVGADHPWVEVATADQSNLLDPPIRQALTPDVAAYWYNPANGIIRARVGAAVTDAGAIDLYNRVNGASVVSLFDGGRPVSAKADHSRRSGSKFLRTASQPKTGPRSSIQR
ncbi:MAG: hypothetical protein JNK58_11470 [Phycisphaerae bacterium]|nr:hypothetical protein [Phycisphaerae bacterium]